MLHGAIVGIGKIAQTGHLPAYADPRIRDQAEIVAAADPSPASRTLAAQTAPGVRLYEDLQTLLAKEQVDFLDICTTPQTHRAIIEQGVSRKLHIVCEKPLASTLEDASYISSLLRTDTRLAFVPCHQYRYSPLWAQFKRFLDGQSLKDGFLLEFSVYRTEADPGLHRGGPVWRTDRKTSGGGILADTGVHYLYLSLWMLGLPAKVSARVSRLARRDTEVEDTALVTLEYKHGLVQIILTWAADRRANKARCVTPRGSLAYDGQSLVRRVGDQSDRIPVPDASDKTHYITMYADLLSEFLGHVRSGAPSTPWIDEGYHAVRLLHACYRSAQEERTVHLDEMT